VLLDLATEGELLEFIGERWRSDNKKARAPTAAMRVIRPMTEEGWRPVTDQNPVPLSPPSVNTLLVRCCSHAPTGRPSFAEVVRDLEGICAKEVAAATEPFKRYASPEPPAASGGGGSDGGGAWVHVLSGAVQHMRGSSASPQDSQYDDDKDYDEEEDGGYGKRMSTAVARRLSQNQGKNTLNMQLHGIWIAIVSIDITYHV